MARPLHLVAAGIIITSPNGRILMVRTLDRVGLILPGGLVEDDESPAVAAVRETSEELGLTVGVDRLLAVEHRDPVDGRPSSLQLVFSADRRVDEETALRLQADEIAEAHWVDPDEAVRRHAVGGQDRMRVALHALAGGRTAYLDT